MKDRIIDMTVGMLLTIAVIGGLVAGVFGYIAESSDAEGWNGTTAVVISDPRSVAVTSKRSENRADVSIGDRQVRDIEVPSDWRTGDAVTVWARGEEVRAFEPRVDVPLVFLVAMLGTVLTLMGAILASFAVESWEDRPRGRQRSYQASW